ncbi:MAG: outer membrane protein transport protein [Gammaproteobacteria bacterium]|nr:outer membrane protein transport protein [Gammaproteobacteria bacterium]
MATIKRITALWVAGVLAVGSQQACAAGFMLFEYSVSGLGNALAGGAASAEDASTIYANPAGMTRLGNSQFLGGAHVILPSTKFKDSNSQTAGGASLEGGDGGDGGVNAVVPNLFYSHAIDDRWTAGLGITVPFGLSTDYDDGWQGRYHALESDLRTVNINPSVAFQVTPRWSVGLGVSALHGDLKEFSNAIDNFGVCGGLLQQGVSGVTSGTCGALGGPANATVDSRVKLEGDDWGYGFNVGVLFQPDSRTRIGLSYRSKVELELDGSADYRLPDAAAAASFRNAVNALPTVLSDSGASADLTLPEIVSISSFQQLSDRWSLMGDITWTRWSRFDSLVVEFDNGAPNLVIEEDWDNSFRVALGMTYTPSPTWTWRFGVAYDQAAAKRNDRVSPRIPDEDRTWVTAGFSFAATPSINLDVGYAHLFMPDRKIRLTNATTGHVLEGEFESEVDILSAQLNWTF